MQQDVDLVESFEQNGRLWLRNALSQDDLNNLDFAASLEAKPGQRLELTPMLEKAFAADGSIMQAIAKIDPFAKPVRVVAFNKTPDTNWGVPWHQDRVICVAKRHDVDGFKNWTQKSNVWHCEPPQALLNNMLFVRIHLDDTDATNGAMNIAVGSHAEGIIPSKDIDNTVSKYQIESCDARRGDVLILKMLTMHGSQPSQKTGNRRVFRIDFASEELPQPLCWS